MKKIVAVIVEGISDETVITTGLSQILESKDFNIQIFRGNLLTSDIHSPLPSKALIGNYINKAILDPNHLIVEDIAYIIQIVDIDKVYSITNLNRFQSLHKDRLNQLSRTKSIMEIPYYIYYMSANLEEVLSGKIDCTDEEKEEISNEFALKYMDDYSGYKSFFELLVEGRFTDYASSWAYIKNGSAEKMSNLSCFLELVEGLKYANLVDDPVLTP